MTSDPIILQIALKTPLRRTFDYLALPSLSADMCQKGMRVLVSFGRREMIGVIVDIAKISSFSVEKLKTIIAVLDDVPVIDSQLLTLYEWASQYYQHALGDVIVGTLPKKIRQGCKIECMDHETISTIEKSFPSYALTQEQITAIHAMTNSPRFQPFLLAGVTGSGKTEVYFRVMAHVLQQNQQVLLLVPEIALTPQTVARVQARFSAPVLLLHSGLSEGRRYKAWLQATHNQPCIVIGTRSAVFAPLPNCGVIVVDEEHDTSFKQQSGFRYSARDVAVMRAKISDIPVILGSATPALETLQNVVQSKYRAFHLTVRPWGMTLPMIRLHNICREKLHKGLSKPLIETMRRHLNNNNQILLYLNRRGYAPVLLCHGCGWSVQCMHCDARMTVHHQPKRLLCHHCGCEQAFVRVCQKCRQSELMELGLGTAQLAQTIAHIFPDKKVCRVDRDSIKTFSALEETLAKVHAQEIDILIGTQMLVKGHHFENVTLVAALDVDHALFSSDFRAIERLGQSLIQVSGRAGRAEKSGEVFIQTHHPDHPLLKKLFDDNYLSFADVLLAERKQTQLPPFVHMIVLRAEGKDKKRVETFLQQVSAQLRTYSNQLDILGPLPALMERRAGMHRAQLYLHSARRNDVKFALSQFIQCTENAKPIFGVKWFVDVDPIEL